MHHQAHRPSIKGTKLLFIVIKAIIIMLPSVGTPAIDRVLALPQCSTLGCSLSLLEFGRSRHRVLALPPSLGALLKMVMTCIQVHMCVGLSVVSDTLGFMLSLGLRHGTNKSTRWPRHHVPARSRQRRATQLGGCLPALFAITCLHCFVFVVY